jgi:Arc/MetJ-type ribon-helix-helix transcriptional regulator
MAQINVRVDDETRDDWEEIVENDPRFRSVQELIRHAMADYIDENDLEP